LSMCGLRPGVLVFWALSVVLSVALALVVATRGIAVSWGSELAGPPRPHAVEAGSESVSGSMASSEAAGFSTSVNEKEIQHESGPVARRIAGGQETNVTRMFFFTHVPKSAGWETWTAIKAVANAGQVCERPNPVMLWPPGIPWGDMGCSSHGVHCSHSEITDCYLSHKMGQAQKGHCGAKKPKRRLPERWLAKSPVYTIRAFKFITVLRKPVDRVVSEYYWWRPKSGEKAWDRELHAATKGGLMGWALSPHNNAHNRMTKQVAFFPSMRAPGTRGGSCTSYGAEPEKVFWSALYNRSVDDGLWAAVNQDDKLLDNAIRSMSDRFAVVGLTERMGDSLAVICNVVVRLTQGLPWDSRCGSSVIRAAVGGDAKHLHKNGHKMPNTTERARLEKLNRLDVELYRSAQRLLDEQLALGGGR